jgi:hypothetical protein
MSQKKLLSHATNSQYFMESESQYCFHKDPPLVSDMSQMNPVHIHSSYFHEILSLILQHVDPLLGNDRGINKYKTPLAT